MASETYRGMLQQVKASPIADCVRPSDRYHHDSARTLCQWGALEELGLVRLIAEPDLDYEWDGDGPDPCPGEEAFGSVGQYRLDLLNPDRPTVFPFGEDDRNWVDADSVWGHVGYRDCLDWRENPYVLDIMRGTIDAFRAAWKDHVHHQCPPCHGSGRSS